MNDQNLRPPTTSEARERGRLGGLASGESRRERRALRDCLEAALESEDYEVDGHLMNGYAAVTVALIKRALQGSTTAYQLIRDGLGERPIERLETVAAIDPEVRARVEAFLGGDHE